MNKSPDAFRTISEVADWLGTPTHVLRFWESRFPQVKPVKRAGGRRYYRPADMALLGGIKKLLHDDGLTIRGVQKILREEGVKHVAGLSPPVDPGQDEPDEAVEDTAKVLPLRPAAAEAPADAGPGGTAAAATDSPADDDIPAFLRRPRPAPEPAAPETAALQPDIGDDVAAAAEAEPAPAEAAEPEAAEPPEPAPEPAAPRPVTLPDIPEPDTAPGVAERVAGRLAGGARADADALGPLVARLRALRDRMATDTTPPVG